MSLTPPDEQPASAPQPQGQGQAALRTYLANASKLSLAMAITIPLGFVTRIMIPRFLGSEKAGMFFFAESFPSLLLMLLPLGISAYIQKAVPPDHSRARFVLTPLLALQAVLGVFLIGCMLAYMQVTHYEPSVIMLTAIMACVQAMMLFQSEVLQALLVAVGRINFVALMNVVSKVLLVLLVLASLLLGGGNLYALAASYLLTQIVVFCLMMKKAHTIGMVGGEVSRAGLKSMIQISLPFFLGGVLANSNGSIDIAILSRLADFHEIGFYGSAQRIQGLFMVLVPLVGSAMTPLLSSAYSRDPAEYKMLAAQIMRGLMIFALGLGSAITAFGQEIILTIYGEEFRPAASVITLTGPLVLYSYVSIFLVQNIIISTNGRSMAKVLAGGFAINFLLDYALIPQGLRLIGPGGGACGSALASLVVEIVTALLLIKVSNKTVFTPRTTYTLVMVTWPLILLVLLSRYWFQLPFLPRVGLFVALLPAYLAASRLVTRADIGQFAALLKKRK